MFTFLAIPRLGVALGQGIWSAVAICVGFLIGVVGPKGVKSAPKSIAMCIVGLLIVLAGVSLLVWNSLRGSSDGSDDDRNSDCEESESLVGRERQSKDSHLLGALYAAIVGASGASILLPASLSELKGIAFTPSFGIGTLACSSALALLFRSTDSGINASVGVMPWAMAILAGIIWNGGNISCLYAIQSLGYSVAMPIMQAAIVPAGVWGIVCFQEMPGKRERIAFAVGSAFVLAGTATIAAFK